jgi:hypothetical protein
MRTDKTLMQLIKGYEILIKNEEKKLKETKKNKADYILIIKKIQYLKNQKLLAERELKDKIY